MKFEFSKKISSFVVGATMLGLIIFIVHFIGLRLFPELKIPTAEGDGAIHIFNFRMQVVFIFASYGLWSLAKKSIKLGNIILEGIEQALLPRGDY